MFVDRVGEGVEELGELRRPGMVGVHHEDAARRLSVGVGPGLVVALRHLADLRPKIVGWIKRMENRDVEIAAAPEKPSGLRAIQVWESDRSNSGKIHGGSHKNS